MFAHNAFVSCFKCAGSCMVVEQRSCFVLSLLCQLGEVCGCWSAGQRRLCLLETATFLRIDCRWRKNERRVGDGGEVAWDGRQSADD